MGKVRESCIVVLVGGQLETKPKPTHGRSVAQSAEFLCAFRLHQHIANEYGFVEYGPDPEQRRATYHGD